MPSNSNLSQQPKYSIIEPARFRLDGGAMFGIIPKPLWNKIAPADQQNRIDLALRLWMIETEEHLVLVDTGIGDYHGEKFDLRFDVRGEKSPLAQALEKLGKSCDQITDLVISHLHFDHVGGIGELIDGQMVPTFQKARCHVHKAHYDYAHNPTERDVGSFQPHYFDPILDHYQNHGQLFFHEGDEGILFELSPSHSLKFKVSHGHTPYLMHPYDHQYLYLADLIPTSHHIPIPWVMGYDINPGLTTQDKRHFLNFIKEKNLKVIFEHDPQYWGSTIDINQKGHFTNSELFKAKDSLAYSL